MPTIDSLVNIPQRTQTPATFAANADALWNQLNTFAAQTNAVGADIVTRQTDVATKQAAAATSASNAATSEANAVASAAAAAATANATAWNAATYYALNANAISQIDFRTYRRKVAGTTATDPANDATNWVAVVPPFVGVGGVTLTSSTTLTASSPAQMLLNPQGAGMVITLPVATTCAKNVNLFSAYNIGDFDVSFADSAGKVLGFCRSLSGCSIGLPDNTTAAGTWAPSGLQKVGISASYNNPLASFDSVATFRVIQVDSNRTCFLFGGTTCFSLIYDRVNGWGNPTAVISGITSGAFNGALCAANQILVVAGAGTVFKSLTLTLTGLSVAPNSIVSATATTYSIVSSGIGQLVYVPAQSAWITTFKCDTQSTARAVTISGTVPTIGTDRVLQTGASNKIGAIYVSGSIARCVSSLNGTVAVTPFTLVGSALTAGTPATVSNSASNNAFKSFLNGNGNIVVCYRAAGDANLAAAISKLTGTTESFSTVNVGTASTSTDVNSLCDFSQITSSKSIIVWADTTFCYANILTDTSGAASVGTPWTYNISGSNNGVGCCFVTGNYARVMFSGTTSITAITFDCSASSVSPVNMQSNRTANAGLLCPVYCADTFGVKSGFSLVNGQNFYSVTLGDTSLLTYKTTLNNLARYDLPTIQSGGTSASTFTSTSGAAVSESWLLNQNNYTGTTGLMISKVEAAV